MFEKPARQSGSAVIIAIVAVVVVVIAVIVFVVVINDDDSQPKEPQPESSSLPADAELPVNVGLEQLQASISDPNLSWSEKADVWADFLDETRPTPNECQQLPAGDSSFFATIQPVLDRGDYSPDISAFLNEMVAIATKHDILDNEWNDAPEALEQAAQLTLEHGTEISRNDDGLLLCLHSKPQPLQTI